MTENKRTWPRHEDGRLKLLAEMTPSERKRVFDRLFDLSKHANAGMDRQSLPSGKLH
jgi:hypothetical protein